jgi:hypothetical protein
VKPTSLRAWNALGDDVVRAVLVADHRHDGDLAEQDWPSVVIGLGDLGVKAPLRDAGGVPHPRGSGEDQDVGGQNLLPNRRPRIAVTHILLDTGLDVMIHTLDGFAGHAVLL